MPTTIKDIVRQFDFQSPRCVKWGEKIPTECEGLYIVCQSDETTSKSYFNAFPLSKTILTDWMKQFNGFTIDKKHCSDVEDIAKRLSEFWLPDENILYIGKAPKRGKKGLGNRVYEFYRTDYGKKRPHAGGHWIKALKSLNNLYVYYFPCSDVHKLEIKLLRYFISNVSEATKQKLRDQELLLPFANLELGKGQVKKHGLGKMKR